MGGVTGGGWLEALPWNGIGVVGLVLMVAVMNWRNLLEFKPQIDRREAIYQERLADKDRQILKALEAADQWRAAFDSSQTGKHELLKQNTELIRSAEINVQSWNAIRAAIERPRKSERTADRGG